MPLTDKPTRERIRELNDQFRKTFDPTLGRVVLTAGVDALPSDVRAMAIRKVATFDAFSADTAWPRDSRNSNVPQYTRALGAIYFTSFVNVNA
jgi:hypothetical protein